MKDHQVTVTIKSTSFGVDNSVLENTEYAMDAEELVYKHYTIADAVLTALTGDNAGEGGAIREMSEQFLDVMAESGGDLGKALENTAWKKRKPKAKPKAKRKTS